MLRLSQSAIVKLDDSGNIITTKTVGSCPHLDVCTDYICEHMLVLTNGFYISSEKELSRTSVERHKLFFSVLDKKILSKSWNKILDFCFIEKSQLLFQLPYFARYLAYFLANNNYPGKNAMCYFKEKRSLKNSPQMSAPNELQIIEIFVSCSLFLK